MKGPSPGAMPPGPRAAGQGGPCRPRECCAAPLAAAGSPNVTPSAIARERTRRSESAASFWKTSGQAAGIATCRRPRSDSSIPVKSDERSVDRPLRPSSSTRSAIDSGVPIAPIRRAMNSWISGILDPAASRAARDASRPAKRLGGVPVHERQVVIAGVSGMADQPLDDIPARLQRQACATPRPGRAGRPATDRFAPARRTARGSARAAVLARWPTGSSRLVITAIRDQQAGARSSVTIAQAADGRLGQEDAKLDRRLARRSTPPAPGAWHSPRRWALAPEGCGAACRACHSLGNVCIWTSAWLLNFWRSCSASLRVPKADLEDRARSCGRGHSRRCGGTGSCRTNRS